MGNKIITEKDFWMCSSGAMPAQLQGTRKSNMKSSGEVYITVADTATSSWIDFGCTKNMLLAALITAVVVIVVVVAIVGTGGVAAIGLLGMMAIGAGAGVTAGVIAAIDGALTCGQKNATARTWDGSKDDFLCTNTPAITGNRTMACSVGGVVKFAPEIKSWMGALALGGFNYVTQLAGCALGGAGIGAGGFLAAGLAGGSLAIAAPTFGSVMSNIAGGFTGIWGGSRVLFGLNSLANENAYGNIQDGGDVTEALVNGGVPEIGMAQRIFTGQAHPSDYLLFLYLLNIKAKGPKTPAEDGNNNPKDEDGNQPKDEDGAQSGKGKGEEGQNKPKDGVRNAYEANPKDKIIKSPTTDFGKLRLAYEYYTSLGWPKGRIQSHMDGIDFTKPVELVEIPANKDFSQYQAPGGDKGLYFAKPSAKATELGINPRAELPDGTIVNKTKELYTSTTKQTVLKSTARSDIKDTWSVKSEPPYTTKGSGTQYFTKDNSIFIPKK